MARIIVLRVIQVKDEGLDSDAASEEADRMADALGGEHWATSDDDELVVLPEG